jgi:hypothetical protein
MARSNLVGSVQSLADNRLASSNPVARARINWNFDFRVSVSTSCGSTMTPIATAIGLRHTGIKRWRFRKARPDSLL